MTTINSNDRRELLQTAAQVMDTPWKWVKAPRYDYEVPGLKLTDSVNDVDYFPAWNPLESAEDRQALIEHLKLAVMFDHESQVWRVGGKFDQKYQWLAEDAQSSLAVLKAVKVYMGQGLQADSSAEDHEKLHGLTDTKAALVLALEAMAYKKMTPEARASVAQSLRKALAFEGFIDDNAKAPDEPGWICEDPRYGTWFISRAAVLADQKQDHAQAYPGEAMPSDDRFDPDVWFYEQTSWIEVLHTGVLLKAPSLLEELQHRFNEMRRNSDYLGAEPSTKIKEVGVK